jgi:predicted Zn-dependent protease
LVLHAVEQYGAADRSAATGHFGLTANVSVMAVVEGSPAARAGIQADDRLIAVNEQAFAPNAAASKLNSSRAPVQQAHRTIFRALEKGEISLRVSGSRGERHVRFRADRGCPADVELLPGDDVNAWADGERVVVSAGILRRSRGDDDLALVIAHELAHNLLRHGRGSVIETDRRGTLFLPSGTAVGGTQRAEEEADRLAVKLAKAAGYNLSGAAAFLADVAGVGPASSGARTHPPLGRRVALLKREIGVVAH